jgi:predicted flap endonuclease-1-like 5' DNA nuclease
MDPNQTTVLLIVGVLAILFLIALFYILRIEGKKQKTTASQETKPQAATIETPKKAEAVQAVQPKPQAATVETPKKAEAVQAVQPKPQAATIETPKKAEAVQAVEPKPQAATVETPKKAEPAHMEEAKAKQTERQKVRAGKKPAPKRKSRGSKIIEIEGIGPTNAEKLNSINISTTSDLLESGATPRGRKELADKTGISSKLILEWVNLADLFRIKGIGEEYSDLLEEAGVDTVVELSRRNAVNLHAKILEVNEAKKLVRRPPSLTSIENWIQEAKDLPRVVEY